MHIFLFVFVFREVKESTQLLYCNTAERKFNRGEKDKYSHSEKDELGKLCVKCKEEYGKKMNENKSTEKTHNEITKRRIYCSCSSRVLQRPRSIEKSVKLGKRCYDQQMRNQLEIVSLRIY